MADPQTDQSSQPLGSLPPSLINPPEDMSYFAQPKSLLTSPVALTGTQTASLPQPTPTPTPPQPAPSQPAAAPIVQPQPSLPPATAPAVAPPTPLQPPPAAAPAAPAPQQPQHPPTYVAVGDSLAAGIAQARKFNERYDVADNPASKADPSIMAASGRTTAQTLATINANPQQFAGQDVLLSTGMSNDLMGGGKLDDAMTNVASQLDALRKAGANVALAGVGSGVPGYQQANARLAQIAKAYGVPFTGEPSTTQGGRVHPSDYNAFYGQFHFGGQQPTPGTGKTIDDATAYIQQREGGGPFILYGHEGQPYDPNSMPTKPGYYGFPDWAGGYGSDGRPTHAAGGAQWEPDTWKTAVEGFTQQGLATQLGHTPDFRNPADQKAVFNYWADRRYREQTGRDLVADLNAGHVDWSALGSEWSSLKYAGGGGIAGMTVSNLPGFQKWQQDNADAQQLGQQEIAEMQKRMADMEAGSPEQRALADQVLKKQIELMDRYETMIAHPPTQKPHDMIGNFGSIATLIGIFAGRFAHRPMVASLNAAGAAMQAMNDNDYQAYQNAFNTWKTQAGMTQSLIGMESSTYKGIMDDQHKTMEEKLQMMETSAKVYQNAIMLKQADAGNYEKMWEYAEKLQKTNDDHALAVQQIDEANQKQEAFQQTQAQIQRDNADWDAANPQATDSQKQAAHYDNYMKRMQQLNTLTSPLGRSAAGMMYLEQEQAVKALDDEFAATYPNSTDAEKAKAHTENVLAVQKQFATAKTADKPLSLPQVKAQAIQDAVKTADDEFAAAHKDATDLEKRKAHNENVKKALMETTLEGSAPRGSVPAMLLQQFKLQYPDAGLEEQQHFVEENILRQTIMRSYGSGPTQRNVISLNTAAGHIMRLREYAKALDTGDPVRINAMQQWIERETGGQNITNFELARDITADEVVRLLTSTGGSEQDRETMQKRLSAWFSPDQMGTAHEVAQDHGSIGVLEDFVGERFKALEQGYALNDPQKAKEFRDNFLMPEAQTMFERNAAKTTGAPAWATGSATGPNNEQIYTDGKAWFHADHTPVQ